MNIVSENIHLFPKTYMYIVWNFKILGNIWEPYNKNLMSGARHGIAAINQVPGVTMYPSSITT